MHHSYHNNATLILMLYTMDEHLICMLLRVACFLCTYTLANSKILRSLELLQLSMVLNLSKTTGEQQV